VSSQNFIRRATVVVGCILVTLIIVRVIQTKARPVSGVSDLTLADFGPAPDFSLLERSGKKMSLADLKGKPWIGDFIFTRCGGPCPLLSLRMSELQKEYLSKTNLHFVSFTVDPEYDSPQVLSVYARQYNADPARWLFFTGDSLKIVRMIVDGFHLAVEKNTDPNQKPGEQVNHSLSFVLVDKDARIRGYYTGNDLDSLNRLRRDIDTLTKK
jgi:protein SCO1/2